MNTSDQFSTRRQRRRRHSEAFKSEAVTECRRPGVSIAAIALSRGVNANLLRRWVVEAEQAEPSATDRRPDKPLRAPTLESAPAFVAVSLATKSDDGSIRMEMRRGSTTIVVQWPASSAQVCAMLLRELLR